MKNYQSGSACEVFIEPENKRVIKRVYYTNEGIENGHNKLLHEIDDGTGQKKYCVCRCSDNKHSKHIHFYCYKCEKTYCLEDFFVPNIILPSNFIIQDAEFIIKGICNKCINKE